MLEKQNNKERGFKMYWLHGNDKTWAEMTPQEQKACLIFVGVVVIGLAVYGIYYYFKKKKKDK